MFPHVWWMYLLARIKHLKHDWLITSWRLTLIGCHWKWRLRWIEWKQILVRCSSISFYCFLFVYVNVKLAWSKDLVKVWCSLCKQKVLKNKMCGVGTSEYTMQGFQENCLILWFRLIRWINFQFLKTTFFLCVNKVLFITSIIFLDFFVKFALSHSLKYYGSVYWI